MHLHWLIFFYLIQQFFKIMLKIYYTVLFLSLYVIFYNQYIMKLWQIEFYCNVVLLKCFKFLNFVIVYLNIKHRWLLSTCTARLTFTSHRKQKWTKLTHYVLRIYFLYFLGRDIVASCPAAHLWSHVHTLFSNLHFMYDDTE